MPEENKKDKGNAPGINLTPLPEPPKLPDFSINMPSAPPSVNPNLASSGGQLPPVNPTINQSTKTRTGLAELTPPPEPPSLQPGPATYHQEAYSGAGGQDEIARLRGKLARKESEMMELYENFKELKEHLKDVEEIINSKDIEAQELRSTMELVQGELKNKEKSLFRAKAKIEVLEESIAKLRKEILVLKKERNNIINERDELEKELRDFQKENLELKNKLEHVGADSKITIDTLRKEKFEINERLKKRMEEVDELKMRIMDQEESIAFLNDKVSELKNLLKEKENEPIHFEFDHSSQLIEGRENILRTISDLIKEAFHSILIVVPTIMDLKELDLESIKSTVQVRIATNIDRTKQEHLDYFSELSKKGNFQFRLFDKEDRYGLNLERGRVLMGFNSKEKPVAMVTADPDGIDLLLNKIIIESWTLGRRLSL
ncbi:MAG: hypothetical protein ACTSYS_08510 [Promethearchaeota archaeon]